MANLNEASVWEAGIYQLETTDPVIGGPDGVDNKQAKQLANRTVYLKTDVDALKSGTTAAGKANTWSTARSISMTGDGTWTVSVNGSGNVTAAMTLANSGVVAGSYTKVTVDVKGRVTAGAAQTAADIPALDWSKITTGKPTTLAGFGITDAHGPTIKPTFAQATMVADPVNAMEAATKQYVDNMAAGIQVKQSVHVATTANTALSGLLTLDGVVLVAGDRVLVKNQNTASQNGIYVAAAGAWTRTADTDTWLELISAFCFVEEGTVNSDTGWVCTINTGGTLGTTAIAWIQFAGAGTVTAGVGMVVSGNQVALGVPSTINGATANAATGGTHTHAVATASETVAGVSEIATQLETDAGLDDVRAVTPLKLATQNRTSDIQIYATPGSFSFVVPDILKSGTKLAKLTVTGGGASGGRGDSAVNQTGAGGGAGGTAIGFVDLKGVASVLVAIGAGGAPSSANSVAGGSSSFGSYLSATGGVGAAGATGAIGGAGGVGAGGKLQLRGGYGSDGTTLTLERGAGNGGASFWGGGGRSSSASESQPAAFGSGGGGSSAGTQWGNPGIAGIVVIEW